MERFVSLGERDATASDKSRSKKRVKYACREAEGQVAIFTAHVSFVASLAIERRVLRRRRSCKRAGVGAFARLNVTVPADNVISGPRGGEPSHTRAEGGRLWETEGISADSFVARMQVEFDCPAIETRTCYARGVIVVRVQRDDSPS